MPTHAACGSRSSVLGYAGAQEGYAGAQEGLYAGVAGVGPGKALGDRTSGRVRVEKNHFLGSVEHLLRRFAFLRRHGYLLATVAVKPER